LRVYPRETVVAEKCQAMVVLGMANSRMKDFFDLYYLSQQFEFSGSLLTKALKATFHRRNTVIPDEVPLAFTDVFTENSDKMRQWQAFLKRGKLESTNSLQTVCSSLARFLLPPLQAMKDEQSFDQFWLPTGPWRAK
jgi:hypothetical protein